jgi:hypothetical protein
MVRWAFEADNEGADSYPDLSNNLEIRVKIFSEHLKQE